MSNSSEEELNSVDRTTNTNESTDENVTHKLVKDNSNETEGKNESRLDTEAQESPQLTDPPLENPQEKHTFEKQTGTQMIEIATDVKHNVSEDKTEIVQESTAKILEIHQPVELPNESSKTICCISEQITQTTDAARLIQNKICVEGKNETVQEKPTNPLKTHQSTDLPIENPNEEDTPLKQTTKTMDSLTHMKSENIVESASAVVQEKKTREVHSNENTSASNDKNIATSKILGKETEESFRDEHAEHVTYDKDGTAIYTDPKTNYQYKWCPKESNWIPNDATTSTDAYENEHYKWCSESQKWIPKQTQVTETEHYKWDADKNQWVAKVKETTNNPTDVVYDIDEDGQRTYTDKDGVIFFWDVEKNAWFPKIDDDFMARYQMNYGFIDNTSESEKEKEKRDLEAALQKEKELAQMVEEAKANEVAAKTGLKRKQPQEPPKWFEIDAAHNTKVYVSNLPLDITLDEFADFMGKCGMIMRDPQTQKYKIKLYTEADGQVKGDGLCDYIKVESVDLALKILDEYDLRGHKIRVQRAQFQMRGEYNPALKPKRKKKDKEKLAKIKEKLFDWRPEKMRGERSKNEKTVILKNLFDPDLFEKEVQLILDYQNDLREECGKCGTVRKVVIYDRHSEGVAQVNMSTPEEADLVIQMMHGRFFGKRKLTAEHWDGKTKYKIEETEEEIQKRLNKWDQYLGTEENKNSGLPQKEKETQRDKE